MSKSRKAPPLRLIRSRAKAIRNRWPQSRLTEQDQTLTPELQLLAAIIGSRKDHLLDGVAAYIAFMDRMPDVLDAFKWLYDGGNNGEFTATCRLLNVKPDVILTRLKNEIHTMSPRAELAMEQIARHSSTTCPICSLRANDHGTLDCQ